LNIEQTKYRNLSFFGDYKKSDYLPNPTNGFMIRIKSGWIFKETPGKNKIIPVTEFDGASYLPLLNRIVFSFSAHYREISDSKTPVYEQYKIGGFHSVRGYQEDYNNGWRIGWINAELRYLMTRDSRVFLLFDNGGFQKQTGNFKTDLFGTGIGLSILTKVGIISTSYALAYTGKHISTFNQGMLHIGLEGSF
jgi:outer membrane protein assembly factor BamA